APLPAASVVCNLSCISPLGNPSTSFTVILGKSLLNASITSSYIKPASPQAQNVISPEILGSITNSSSLSFPLSPSLSFSPSEPESLLEQPEINNKAKINTRIPQSLLSIVLYIFFTSPFKK